MLETSKYILPFLVLCIFSLHSCKTIILCPPNDEPVILYKKDSKNYPTYVKTFDAKVEGALETTLNLGKLDLKTSVKNNVTLLREKLNQLNISWENILTGALIAYRTTPCDLKVRAAYFHLLDEIKEEVSKIESLNLTLNKFEGRSDFGQQESKELNDAIKQYVQSTSF